MCDTHMPLFNNALMNLDVDQKNLLYWIKYYNHHVFSKDSRPDDFVIDYDILLDDWVERKEFEEEQKNKSHIKGRSQETFHFDD